MPPALLVEQVVYGSFAFAAGGYAVLARSARVRPEWADAVVAACRRFGEAPSGVELVPCLFSVPISARGPRAVVGAFPAGLDDRGRPGAMAFHALLVADRDFHRAGRDPWAFAPALRGDWSERPPGGLLPPLTWNLPPDRSSEDPPADPVADRVAAILARGRRVAIEAAGPIDGLARAAWVRLPDRARDRASVATWAFGNDNRFDLVALPRLAGVTLDPSYQPLDEVAPEPAPEPGPPGSGWDRRRVAAWAAGAAAVAGLGLILALRPGPKPDPGPAATPEATPPARDLEGSERARALAGIARLAERFDVPDPEDPAGWAERFAERVRYRGPVLSADERARLAGGGDPDGARAVRWDDQVARFRADRPLPGDLRRLGLDGQLRALAAFYGLPAAEGGSAADIPDALDAALSRAGPVVPTPLAARYPALSEYARFLGRLPRLDP